MTDNARPAFGLVLDCTDAARLADFWASALDYVNVGAAGTYVALYPREGAGPKLLLQQVPEPRAGKNRMHLDIDTPDIEAEAERLIALGACRVGESPCREHGMTWVTMADPEGNEFCICDGGAGAA